MIDEINRLFAALKYNIERFNHFFIIAYNTIEKGQPGMEKVDSELMYLGLESYSANALKIEYELFFNSKIGFVGKIINDPAENLFVYSGLPEGIKSPFELFDLERIKKKKRNKEKLLPVEEKTLDIFHDLREIRDKVICHCDPDNFEVREIIDVHKLTFDEGKDGLVKRMKTNIKIYEHRKEIIDYFFPILDNFVNIINLNQKHAELIKISKERKI